MRDTQSFIAGEILPRHGNFNIHSVDLYSILYIFIPYHISTFYKLLYTDVYSSTIIFKFKVVIRWSTHHQPANLTQQFN